MLVHCEDDSDQAEYVIRRILEHREAGIDLRRQAVLFRASHHSILLEAELARANIPFHKYGGLKFIETAHVKDLLAFLRLAENPRDVVSGSRLLPLLPGVGPTESPTVDGNAPGGRRQFQRLGRLDSAGRRRRSSGRSSSALLKDLGRGRRTICRCKIGRVRKFYAPLLEVKYDNVEPRLRNLEQLELIASRSRRSGANAFGNDARIRPTRRRISPARPKWTTTILVLSTIHSAKGLEWDAVYVVPLRTATFRPTWPSKNAEDRGRAAAVLRRADAGEKLALRLSSAA